MFSQKYRPAEKEYDYSRKSQLKGEMMKVKKDRDL
jgi:hypothetical protein